MRRDQHAVLKRETMEIGRKRTVTRLHNRGSLPHKAATALKIRKGEGAKAHRAYMVEYQQAGDRKTLARIKH